MAEYTDFLGFHPYKEIIFLNTSSLRREVAYQLFFLFSV